MLMIFIYSIIFLLIILFDLIPIKKNNYNNEFTFNIIVLTISYLLIILVGLEIKIPSPSDIIENTVNFFIP